MFYEQSLSGAVAGKIDVSVSSRFILQFFDTVGWATGQASEL